MNAKHLACVLLFAVICGLFQGTMMLNQRMITARDAAEDARSHHESATAQHNMSRILYEKALTDTAANRKYLDMWRQKLELTAADPVAAKNEFSRMLKRFPTLVQFMNQTSAAVEIKDMTYVNRRITSSVKLEGDAEKAIQLLSSIERELPTSRISSLEIRKGQRGNSIEMDLSIESPLLSTAVADKKP